MKRIERSAIVAHSAAEIYALVEQIEAYPRFLPWCLAATVHERSGQRTVATLTVGLPGVSQSFTTENLNRPAAAIEMRLRKGPFRRFSAVWHFHALAERAARIEFSLQVEFSSRVASKALEPLFSHIADTMVDAFTRRADTVYGTSVR